MKMKLRDVPIRRANETRAMAKLWGSFLKGALKEGSQVVLKDSG